MYRSLMTMVMAMAMAGCCTLGHSDYAAERVAIVDGTARIHSATPLTQAQVATFIAKERAGWALIAGDDQ